ncbi:MAG: DUF2252 family protein [Gemmatimonadota bacterium]
MSALRSPRACDGKLGSSRGWGPLAATLLLALLGAGCAGEAKGRPALYVDPADYDFSANPELLERIRSDPHGYFRFINIPFSQHVCELFADRIDEMSSEQRRSYLLNLHGDAHLEQYAVTDLGRGLTDFDDSSAGPPVIDLLRFAVSLRLTSRSNDWDAATEEELIRTFLAGYRAALEQPTIVAHEPSVVEGLRSTFTQDTAGYFEWVDSLMQPMPPALEEELRSAMIRFAEVAVREHPEVSVEYFEPVRMGYLKLGVGSALDTKFIVRMRGPTDDPIDDDVLEVKQVRDLGDIECIEAVEDDPFRILLSQARIAYEPFRWLGYLRLGDNNFWTHAWVQNYRELDVDESFGSPGELVEVAFDVGVQLGIGHHKMAATPFDEMLRQQSRQRLLEHPNEVSAISLELADDVIEAWRRFTAALD